MACWNMLFTARPSQKCILLPPKQVGLYSSSATVAVRLVNIITDPLCDITATFACEVSMVMYPASSATQEGMMPVSCHHLASAVFSVR
jgi:hypothetical protein